MTEPQSPRAHSHIQRAATQFYWIAAFSFVNIVLLLTEVDAVFPIGLTMASLLAALASLLELTGRVLAAMGALGIVGLFALFGYFGKKGASWPFIAGIAIYTLDGIIWGLLLDWIGPVFHVILLFFIIRDLIAHQRQAP